MIEITSCEEISDAEWAKEKLANLPTMQELLARAEEKGRKKVVEEFRQYLKTVIPREMPQEIWDIGVDNTCNRMLKEQIGEKNDSSRTD